MVQLFHCWRCEGVVVARRYPLWSGKKKCWGISTVGDSSFIQGDTSFTRPWSLECLWIYHDLAAVYLCGFHNLYVLYKYNIITCVYIYIHYVYTYIQHVCIHACWHKQISPSPVSWCTMEIYWLWTLEVSNFLCFLMFTWRVLSPNRFTSQKHSETLCEFQNSRSLFPYPKI